MMARTQYPTEAHRMVARLSVVTQRVGPEDYLILADALEEFDHPEKRLAPGLREMARRGLVPTWKHATWGNEGKRSASWTLALTRPKRFATMSSRVSMNEFAKLRKARGATTLPAHSQVPDFVAFSSRRDALFAMAHVLVEATRLASTIKRAMAEVVADVEAGRVPAEVRSFSQLHDYVDANYYGGAFEREHDPSSDEDTNFFNAVQNAVNAWIQAGGIRDALRKYPCLVCGANIGWDVPSGVCSSACLEKGQRFSPSGQDYAPQMEVQ